MKYLRDCPQTQSRLQRWAGDSNLVLAAFYFWRSGTELQCSQRGLLRQLLYEILRASPETIWDLCLTNTDTEEWSLHRLHHVYLQLTTINLNAKLCLFIDGLDEYKGEHLDLSQIINSLASIPSVKLCVSSRRWPCFEDAFGGNASRKIYLEELTRDDIYQFADSRLSEIRRFEIGPSDEQQYLRLVSEITEKAEGVFLWVFLVVRSLRDGLVNGDSVEILRERLLELPSDLELFFETIFNSVDKVYRIPMAVTFRVALQAPFPMTLVTYWFLDEQRNTAKIRWGQTYGKSEDGIHALELDMERRLYGRYKGLLEATGHSGTKKVDLLHRTVRDFLQTTAAGDSFLLQGLQPFTKCCRALVGVMPLYAAPLYDLEGADQTYTYIQLFMVFAKWAEIYSEDGFDVRLISEMSQACKKFNDEGQYKNGFLSVVVKCGFVTGLRHLLSRDRRLVSDHGRQMLRAALANQKLWARDSFGVQPAIDTLDWVLLQGARRYAQDEFPQFLFCGFHFECEEPSSSSEMLNSYGDNRLDMHGEGSLMTYDQWKPSVDLLIRHGANVTEALAAAGRFPGQNLRVVTFSIQESLAIQMRIQEKTRISMIRALERLYEAWSTFIEHGVDVNLPFRESTLWQELLKTLTAILVTSSRSILDFQCTRLLVLFLEKGANPYIMGREQIDLTLTSVTAHMPSSDIRGILESLLQNALARWAECNPRKRIRTPTPDGPLSNEENQKQSKGIYHRKASTSRVVRTKPGAPALWQRTKAAPRPKKRRRKACY